MPLSNSQVLHNSQGYRSSSPNNSLISLHAGGCIIMVLLAYSSPRMQPVERCLSFRQVISDSKMDFLWSPSQNWAGEPL